METKYCSDHHIILIKRIYFWKVYCKIIYGSGSFHKWKNFLIWEGEVIFLDLSKKDDFCTKNHNSKYLQNTKKIFTPWKSSKSQLSNDIKFSTQIQGMTKIWSKLKKSQKRGNFFVPNCIYERFLKIYLLIIWIYC